MNTQIVRLIIVQVFYVNYRGIFGEELTYDQMGHPELKVFKARLEIITELVIYW